MTMRSLRPRTIYIARHGETDWNRHGRFQGRTDVPLNDAGRAQAKALAERLASLDIGAIAASDLSRARQTAEIVAEMLSLPRVHVEPDLRERGYGVFEGLTREECVARYPDVWEAFPRSEPPLSEPRVEVLQRFTRGLLRIVETVALDQPRLLVVTHGAAMRTFLEGTIGLAVPPVPNTGAYEVVHDGRAFVEARLLEGPYR